MFAYHRIAPELRHAAAEAVRPAVRTFLAWFLPSAALIHVAASALHEGPPLGPSLRQRLTACAAVWPLGIVAFFWAAVLCGVSASEQGWATLHFAALMSAFVFLPVAANIAWDGLRWQYIFAHWQPSGTDELSAAIPAAAAVVASWLGAMPTPLDWGTQWQVWPVSSVVAAATAYVLGLIVAVPAAWYIRRRRQSLQQHSETVWED